VLAGRVAAVSTCADTTTYTVHAKRWEHGWELHIDGVGVTQSRTLNDAEAMVRDYIALDTGAAPDSFAVEIVPEVGRGLDEKTRAARQAVTNAEAAQRTAAIMSREVAGKLSEAGLSGREIAIVLRVSPQRVSQLLDRKFWVRKGPVAGEGFPIRSGSRAAKRSRIGKKVLDRKCG
jgi:hypothetical protein